VPALDLGLGAAGHRAFGEMDDRRALRSGLPHELADLSTVLADVGRDPALGRGDLDRASVHDGAVAPDEGLVRQGLSDRGDGGHLDPTPGRQPAPITSSHPMPAPCQWFSAPRARLRPATPSYGDSEPRGFTRESGRTRAAYKMGGSTHQVRRLYSVQPGWR